MVLVMQSEKRGVKIDPALVLQGLIQHTSTPMRVASETR